MHAHYYGKLIPAENLSAKIIKTIQENAAIYLYKTLSIKKLANCLRKPTYRHFVIILSSNGFIKVNYHIEVRLWGSRQRFSTKYIYIQ